MTPLITAFAAAAAFMAGLFILIYLPRKWWTHVTGYTIMATKAGIFLLGVGHILTYFNIEGSKALLAAAWLHMALVLLWRVVLLIAAHPLDNDPLDAEQATYPNDTIPPKETT